jgi:uncharacterized protein YecT (DUF1311 family)
MMRFGLPLALGLLGVLLAGGARADEVDCKNPTTQTDMTLCERARQDAYRDAQCEAAGFQARGGTMEPMLVAGCIADITEVRTKELKALEDAMSN